MDDYSIRQALKQILRERHSDDDSLIIEELGLLEGEARADLAVINGELHGFEIKSEKDTLNRLPRQREAYSQLFDTVTLVVSTKHLTKAKREIPKWWGIIVADIDNGTVVLRERRVPKENTNVHPMAIVRLLWKSESLAVLDHLGKASGMKSKPRDILWKAIAETLPLQELKRIVREKIKARGDWRSAERRKLNGGSLRLVAKSLHSPHSQSHSQYHQYTHHQC